MSLTTEYPLWLVIICIALGITYSTALYYKSAMLTEFPAWLKRLLFIFRALIVATISFYLLNPLIKMVFRETEKPVVILAQDNSASLSLTTDSQRLWEYRKSYEALAAGLSINYDVKTCAFGDHFSHTPDFSFSDKQTDFSSLFNEVYNRYSSHNTGALIIASDGIYNKGYHPLYSSDKLRMPVYTIAMGDTAVYPDLGIKKVAHNRIAYLGNSFPVEVWIDSKKLKGKTALMTIEKNNETLFTKPVEITGDLFSIIVPAQLEAKQAGVQRYTVKLTNVEGEINYENNSRDIYIQVLDTRQKILLLADVPHPDIAAIKAAVESSDSYSLDVFLAKGFTKSVKEYNLVILHQLPSRKNNISAILSQYALNNIPSLFIITSEMDLGLFNNLQAGVSITGTAGKMNDSQAWMDPLFTLFTVSDATRSAVAKFPPLQTFFGNYKTGPATVTLLKQKIGIVETPQPLVLFHSTSDRKTGVFCGEGLWRWRLNDYADHQNHTAFNEIILKSVQYLVVKENKNPFRVIHRTNFSESEPVVFDAEVYNESFELINEPDVTFNIINSDDNRFSYIFSKTSNAYHLNVGNFSEGHYRYEARVKNGDKPLFYKGEFSITAINAEAINTIADHELLYQLAKNHGGEMLYPSQMNSLIELLEKQGNIKPVIYTQKKLIELINIRWIFFLLLLLLTIEWFMRKYYGAY